MKAPEKEALLDLIEELTEQVAYLYGNLTPKRRAFTFPSSHSALTRAYVALGSTKTAETRASKALRGGDDEC